MTDDGDLIADRYRVVTRVGGGAMGVVWEATDEVLHRTVAVKELLLHEGMSDAQTDEATRRALREGRIAARLHHPNAISVYDVAEHDGRPCLIMEYLSSESLSDRLARERTLPPGDVARIGTQIASALAAAHAAGIVHRDVKPGNVLLADDGTAKLTDFGISHATGDGTVTATGVVAGTPAYLSPEVAQGNDAGFPSDVFSLGATLYSAVEGVPPFGLNENAIALVYRIATREVTPPKNGGGLTSTLVSMLERDPARRPTMREAHAALTAVAAAMPRGGDVPPPVRPAPAPAVANPAPAPPPARTPAPAAAPEPVRRRRLVVVGVAVAALVVAGAIGTVLALGGSTSQAGLSPSTPHPAPATPSFAPAATHAPAPATSHSPPPTTADVPGTTGNSTATSTGGTLPAASDPVAAIVGYYQLVPNDLTNAWNGMTADYQQNHAGGWSYYQSFWGKVSSVSLGGVTSTGASSVQATITYHYRTGNVIQEVTNFGLVNVNGQWKIASSSVSSSHAVSG